MPEPTDPPPSDPGEYLEGIDGEFLAAADEFSVPVSILKAVGYVESQWQMVAGQVEFDGQAPAFGTMGLRGEHLRRGAELLGVPELKYDGELSWSRRILKGWFGMAYLQATPKRIRINKLLDSPDINPDTMRFLLWHEFLHIHLSQGHTKTFRDLERRWPGMVDADRQLLTLNERFGVSYW